MQGKRKICKRTKKTLNQDIDGYLKIWKTEQTWSSMVFWIIDGNWNGKQERIIAILDFNELDDNGDVWYTSEDKDLEGESKYETLPYTEDARGCWINGNIYRKYIVCI